LLFAACQQYCTIHAAVIVDRFPLPEVH